MAKPATGSRGKSPRSKATQFKKGSPSPNPKGRPTGSPNRSRIIRKVLDQVVTGEISGQRKKIKLTEAVLLKLAHRALGGELKAIQMVMALWKESEDAIAKEREAQFPFSEQDREVIKEIYARMKAAER